MSEEQKEYIKNNEFNIQFGGRGIAKQKYAKLQQENEYYRNILTEFEKWLEERYKQQTETLNKMEEDNIERPYVKSRKYLVEECLDKLQELKGETINK